MPDRGEPLHMRMGLTPELFAMTLNDIKSGKAEALEALHPGVKFGIGPHRRTDPKSIRHNARFVFATGAVFVREIKLHGLAYLIG